MTIDPEALYTPTEVAEYLRCGKSNVYDLLGKDLAVLKIGAGKRGFRVRGRDILAFVEARVKGGPTPSAPGLMIKHPRLR